MRKAGIKQGTPPVLVATPISIEVVGYSGILDEPPVEPPAEMPARSPDVLGLAPGYSHHVGHGVGRCLTKLQTPCACCNSGSGSDEAVLTKAEELNESCLCCKNRSLAEPGPSREAL